MHGPDQKIAPTHPHDKKRACPLPYPPESGSAHCFCAHNNGHPYDLQAQKETEGTVLTVRARSGLSGDMMLSGLAALAGVTDEDLRVFSCELNIPALEGSVQIETRSINAISGQACRISLPHEHAHRTLTDIAGIIHTSSMPPEAKALALKAFSLLAEAEAAVHGTTPAAVNFHEVGALDSILDICLTCRLFVLHKTTHFVCSPLPLADGVIQCAHGSIPSPAPAVLRMLEGIPVCGFAGEGETVTPTALSLLKALGATFGPWPKMTVRKTAISYGSKVFANTPNGAVWALGAI